MATFSWICRTVRRVHDVAALPLRLDLSEYQDASAPATPVIFDCVGVVLHNGHSTDAGHYRAAAVVQGGSWRLFDDLVVRYSELFGKAHLLQIACPANRGPISPPCPFPWWRLGRQWRDCAYAVSRII